MFKLLSRASAIGGLVAFYRSPTGQQLVSKAKTYANDPRTRQKLAELKSKVIR